MSFVLSGRLEGEQQLSRKLNNLERIDLKKVFDRLGQKYKKFYSGEVFSTEGKAIGEPWVGGPFYNKLKRTGKMKGSFRYKASSDKLVVENTTSYFKYHQSNKSRSRLPRRVMLKLDKQRKDWAVKEVQKEYQKILGGRI